MEETLNTTGNIGARMSIPNVKPPDCFDFKMPETWPIWIKRFERYRDVSRLCQEEESLQVSSLIYYMGEKSETILETFGLTSEESHSYSRVKEKFQNYFVCKTNIVYERAQFNSRVQKETETADDFITSLYELVKMCNYGELQDELVRDRIVIGIKDKQLSETLQMFSDLTLENAIQKVKNSEKVKKQQMNLRQETVSIDRVLKSKDFPRRQYVNNEDPRPRRARQQSRREVGCTRCGATLKHMDRQCPALYAKCFKCDMRGHFAHQCKTKTVDEIEGDSSEYGGAVAYLGVVSTDAEEPWYTTINIEGIPTKIKIDTGADVTVIPLTLYNTLKLQNTAFPKLRRPRKTLFGPSRKKLELEGQFESRISWGKEQCTDIVYVAKSTQEPLLGRPAIAKMEILTWQEKTISEVKLYNSYPNLFQGLGTMRNRKYVIKLKGGAIPYSISTPRRIAIPLRSKVKVELDRLIKLGIISAVKEPTDWCAGLVVVPKSDGGIRLCVDLSMAQTLAQLTGAVVFSKLDANCEFWQILMDKKIRVLTIFIKPFGLFCFNRLPFGISSAPEYYQQEMSQIFEGMEGVLNHMDDVLIHGRTIKEHDQNLERVLKKIEAEGMTLNEKKCQFAVPRVKFLGHYISKVGIESDPEKVRAIRDMKRPENKAELQSFFGMVNYVSKFVPNLSNINKPLRDLLKLENEYIWGDDQDRSFSQIKDLLVTAPVLALYDVNKEMRVSADASSYGLGGVLEQLCENVWRPVAYASRALTSFEVNLAQIEKEALALAWACNRFSHYLLGKTFSMLTDHKPLVAIYGSKPLSDLSPRLQRLKMKLMPFNFTITHVAGKTFYAPDALSRIPIIEDNNGLTIGEIDLYAEEILCTLPATEDRLEEIRKEQGKDQTCQALREYIIRGWPKNPGEASLTCTPYWEARGDLVIYKQLIMKGERLVIPSALRKSILGKIHEGHLGINKCRLRAADSVWWPGLSQEIKDFIQNCRKCSEDKPNHKEPLIMPGLPVRPWEIVGMDLAEREKNNYLVIMDYYSRYPEVFLLEDLSSSRVIQKCKSVFSRQGIPNMVRSDNGPQFASAEFKLFASEYDFRHCTSSPRYPQSNGMVESAVKTVKKIIKRASDPYKGLLAYRNTPLIDLKYSPAQLLMGRKLRTTLPTISKLLQPKPVNHKEFRELNHKRITRQTEQFDKQHRTSLLPELKEGQKVFITDLGRYGSIACKAVTPRSYIVNTDKGKIRRNRFHLKPEIEQENRTPMWEVQSDIEQPKTTIVKSGENLIEDHAKENLDQTKDLIRERSEPVRSRYGRTIKPPNRMDL